MVINHILPAAAAYQSQLAENVLNLKELGLPESDYKSQLDIIKLISENIRGIKDGVSKMTTARRDANEIEDANEMAKAYCNTIKPLMEEIRTYADRLEYLVDDREWPLIKYRELMFVR
jgi:glutamine synthetase